MQITVAETLGVEGRGAYYEESGALRDMVQNHLLQLLVPGRDGAAGDVRRRPRPRRAGPRCSRPSTRSAPTDVEAAAVRGQYEPGTILGEPVPGYREEPGVAPGSTTETYVACGSRSTTGAGPACRSTCAPASASPARLTEIAIQFRRPPQLLFGADAETLPPNHLVLRIQPDEGIAVRFAAKLPVQEFQLRPVTMDFRYGTSFGVTAPEAYERLLLDAMRGDATLFARADWVEAAWRLLTPIQAEWATGVAKLATYEAGSAGPPEADRLLEREGRRWRRL